MVSSDSRACQDVQLVGDDLFVTNPVLLKSGIKDGIANAILVDLIKWAL